MPVHRSMHIAPKPRRAQPSLLSTADSDRYRVYRVSVFELVSPKNKTPIVSHDPDMLSAPLLCPGLLDRDYRPMDAAKSKTPIAKCSNFLSDF